MMLYIIRHGEPDYVRDCLTEFGRLQAEAVGKRMAKVGLDRIYASPMGRAQETAAPACRLLGLECRTEEWAHEIGDERLTPFPDGKLKSVSLLQNTYFRENGNMDLGYDRAFECPGMSDSQMKSAVSYLAENGREFLARLGYREENGVYRIVRPSEERVALFCHAAMGRAWLSVLLHIPINIMWASFAYELTGVTALEFKNNPDGFTAPECKCFSDCSHLYAEDLNGWK